MIVVFDFLIFALCINLFFQGIFKYHKTKNLSDLSYSFSYFIIALLHSRIYFNMQYLDPFRFFISIMLFCFFFLLSGLAKKPPLKNKRLSSFNFLGASLLFMPVIFLFATSFYALINYYYIFKEKKKLYIIYFIFGLTFITFAGLSLVLSYHLDKSKIIPYYLFITAGIVLLNMGEHSDNRIHNINNLSNMVSNVFSYFLIMVLIFFHAFFLYFLATNILENHFHLMLLLYLIFYLLSFFIIRSVLRDNILSQTQTLSIIQDIQSGKVPESPPNISTTDIKESQSIPDNLYKISSIIKKHQESSAEQLNKLKEVDRLRGEFLRNVSHELRTPLTIILGYINLISSKAQKDNLDQLFSYSEHVKAQASILQRLVENILTFSQMEKKTMELYISLIDIPSIFAKLLNEYAPIINHMDINISNKISPFKIYADHDKLYTVFRELLSNATKFTPKGGNILMKSEIIEQQDEDIARFIIQDSGIGIPENKIETSFQKFKQIDGDANREYGGTGMGLPLCKGIVELHNGKISIKSKENHGTRVTIDLPQKKGVIKRISNTEIPDEIDNTKRYFIIIEDDPLIGDLIKHYLEFKGIIGIIVNSGKEISKVLRKITPLGITLDINLPDMDGWKVYDSIRNLKTGKDMPIIVITESDEKGYAMKKGIKMYLGKPIDREVFDAYIDQIIENN